MRTSSHFVDETMESPRRPLQHIPHPSLLSGSNEHFPHPPSLSDTRALSPLSRGRTSPQRISHKSDADDYSQQPGKMEVVFISQRLASLEERFSQLESLLSRSVAKVDTFAHQLEHDRQRHDTLSIRLESIEEQQSTLLKATKDFGARLLQHEEKSQSIISLSAGLDDLKSRSDSHAARIDEVFRAVKRSNDHTDSQSSSIRTQIAHATRLLQSYTRKQCEALSSENAARLDNFDKDRGEIVKHIAEVSQGLNDARIATAEAKAMLLQQDIVLHRHDDAAKSLAEDMKVLQRRLLSALRHLSQDANAFLTSSYETVPTSSVTPNRHSTAYNSAAIATTPSMSSGAAVTQLSAAGADRSYVRHVDPKVSSSRDEHYGSPQSNQIAASWQSTSPNSSKFAGGAVGSATSATPLAAPSDDAGIDQFIAELNFMSRNAVI